MRQTVTLTHWVLDKFKQRFATDVNFRVTFLIENVTILILVALLKPVIITNFIDIYYVLK